LPGESNEYMKYWGLLIAKLIVGVALLYSVWFGLHWMYSPPESVTRYRHEPFLHDLSWTTLMFLYNLLCNGVLFLIILDQRYRCRTCGRRLRMPVARGSHGQMLLLGRPRTEYICTYGHGTLNVPDLHLTGRERSDWKANNDDIWKELFPAEEQGKSNIHETGS
ncbi:MAG TPA: hypothetical protein VMZ52_20830, partial [Bryobacteraceae bacterium]|nr:hypothetical protein [Bryobacteraceae bacterium]